MTDRELANAFGQLRVLCTNIIGFRHLCDHEDGPPIKEADRVMYEAHVYAGGIELARRVYEIAHALEDSA